MSISTNLKRAPEKQCTSIEGQLGLLSGKTLLVTSLRATTTADGIGKMMAFCGLSGRIREEKFFLDPQRS